MTSAQIRQQFLDFFRSKGHEIVPSAPIVVKNDPTLMFTNAGMNQFKDYFLGNKKPSSPRIADTQKCLRVSGKHNDLEEVGVDTYHHTMFEMLGNWSFGDYFKKEAIEWSWELLTKVYGLDPARLYVTIFEGDAKEKLPRDEEAFNEWKKWIPEDRIINGNKKDNFWEMGDTGPCGPCTEIHYDTRPEAKNDGHKLVNNDDTGMVMEIWNNVFIQFNRSKDGKLEPLPAKHVDTGMGLERLTRVVQQKLSNYDTDIFINTISEIEKIAGKKYDYSDSKQAVAFRVISDHLRAISFTIADGQLPSNTGAGYVIRRILRRAVRYYYSYLDYKQPLLNQLVTVLAKQFENVFPELQKQVDFVGKVVKEEEEAFLRTVERGLNRFEQIKRDVLEKLLINTLTENKYKIEVKDQIKQRGLASTLDIYLPELNVAIDIMTGIKTYFPSQRDIGLTIYQFPISEQENISVSKVLLFLKNITGKDLKYNFDKRVVLDGKVAFELFDTYGFPFDLTKLIANENDIVVDENEFNNEMQRQKERSRAATSLDLEDWKIYMTFSSQEQGDNGIEQFVGYDKLETEALLNRYRKVKSKDKEVFQIVLNQTPFYAESGGQVGDTGVLVFGDEEIEVIDTKKENDVILHIINKLPQKVTRKVTAKVDAARRQKIMIHHSATHLLHAALREVLGNHVTQKGSLVDDEHLRFDFSHFAKLTEEEESKIQKVVNKKIRENIKVLIEYMPKEEALNKGAMALFGEKYGESVRVVTIDPKFSIELCGGTHVKATGELGFFVLKSESAIAAGVRRIEALCGEAAENSINEIFEQITALNKRLKNPKNIDKSIENLQTENITLSKHIEHLEARQLVAIRNELLQKDEIINSVNFVADIVEVNNADALKKLCFDLKNHLRDHVAVLCANIGGKPFVAVGISETVVAAKNLDAGKIIKEHVAPLIKGGGGGQKTLATAGGQDAGNLKNVIEKVRSLL